MMVPELEQMDGVDPTALVLASQELHPYVLRLGSPDDTDGVLEVLAIVVLKRSGAFLLAIPDGALDPETLEEGANGAVDSVFGPKLQPRYREWSSSQVWCHLQAQP